MKVVIRPRNFTNELAALNLDYTVERYSHRAIGGPNQAIIHASGDEVELWELVERVRCPITIFSDYGDPLWWGMVSDIRGSIRELKQTGNSYVQVGVSLNTMWNRIAIAYVNVDLTTGNQNRATTAYADAADSQLEYGARELLWGNSAATAAHAEAARDMRLEQEKYPKRLITPGLSGSQSGVTLNCTGWWDTLTWQYYSNAGTAIVDTATQIKTILDAEGQFFNSVNANVASGIAIRETRDGDNTALFYTVEMLHLGTTNNRRMLASVDPHRVVTIYEEPTKPTYPHLFTSDGEIHDGQDTPIRAETCPVAIWARMKDIVPATVDTTKLADPNPFFVEEMEYEVASDRLIPRSRGDLDPWQWARIKDG